jgi:hypothetical protein
MRSTDSRSTHIFRPNLGNCAFPIRAYTICSWPDTHSSYPNLTIQAILRGYALARHLYRLSWSLVDFFCPSTRYPA